jgi:hypothetical protein
MLIGYERKWGENIPSSDLVGYWFESSTGNHFVYIGKWATTRLPSGLSRKDQTRLSMVRLAMTVTSSPGHGDSQ